MIRPLNNISMFKRCFQPLLVITTLILSPFGVANSDNENHKTQRIISTDSNSTAMLLELGVASDIIAIDVTSELPERFPELPNIGYHRTLSAEGLLSLNPTLIVGSEHMGPAATVSALRKAKIPIITLSSANSIDSIKNNVTKLASAIDRINQGNKLLNRIDALSQRLQSENQRHEKIAFLLTREGHKMQLAGSHTGGGALVNTLGASNVANFENYRNVTAEALLEMQPSVILVAGSDRENSVSALLTANPILRHSNAAKSNRILAVNSSTLVAGLSIAALQEAERLTKALQGN